MKCLDNVYLRERYRNNCSLLWTFQNPAFVPLRLRRTTLGSRYLAYDLTDLPVPAEEWSTNRRRAKTCRDSRSISLQSQRRPPPVLRQSSTPMILENRYVEPMYGYLIFLLLFLLLFLNIRIFIVLFICFFFIICIIQVIITSSVYLLTG